MPCLPTTRSLSSKIIYWSLTGIKFLYGLLGQCNKVPPPSATRVQNGRSIRMFWSFIGHPSPRFFRFRNPVHFPLLCHTKSRRFHPGGICFGQLTITHNPFGCLLQLDSSRLEARSDEMERDRSLLYGLPFASVPFFKGIQPSSGDTQTVCGL